MPVAPVYVHTAMQHLGFIGIGVMGEPMAARLLTAGYPVEMHDVVPERLDALLRNGAVPSPNVGTMPDRCSMIFLMVRNQQQLEDVLFGPTGLAASLHPAHTLVCLSTIPADAIRDIGARLPGVGFLDAPVSGGRSGAETGNLTILVGGLEAVYLLARPVLECMGSAVVYLGDLGAAQVIKAANQILVALNRAAVGEALLFVRRNGIDVAAARRALLLCLGRSFALEEYGARVEAMDNPVQFDSQILRKDLHALLGQAGRLGLDLPFATLAREMYDGWDALPQAPDVEEWRS